jgi:hypothetical protein
MSNSNAILAVLNASSYDVVRDEVRADMLAYAKQALASYKTIVANWKASEVLPAHCRSMADYKTFPKCRISTAWISNKVDCSENGCMGTDYYRKLQATVAGWTVNEAEVQKSADQTWEETKAFYAARVGEKIDILLGSEAGIVLNVSKDRELVGHCRAFVADKELVLETNMKTNYRYGENAADGHLTIYRQVPTLVASAKGFDPIAVEAAYEAAKLAAKTDKKAELRRLGEAVDQAERRKRTWEDLYTTLRFASQRPEGLINGNLQAAQEIVAKLGLTIIPTLAEAKLGYKSAQAAHKAAKEALKAAKVAG